MNRPEFGDDLDVSFGVWRNDGTEADARPYRASSPQRAAEQHAREDWLAGATSWPIAYCTRDGITGAIWAVEVTIAMRPSFITVEAHEVSMPAATHVLWGGHALCADLRLRGVPRDWPAGQRWISLKDVADGIEAPPDRCETCWAKAPGLVDGIRQIGAVR